MLVTELQRRAQYLAERPTLPATAPFRSPQERIADPPMVGCCGLYCGACRRHTHGACPGCHQREDATRCKARACCHDNGLDGCADCHEVADVRDCAKFNTLLSRIFSFIFRSDRPAGILAIREKGCEAFAKEMAERKTMAIRR